MIQSMTAYSSRRAEEKQFSLSVSVRSINHRFLDLQVRLPAELEPFEPVMRRLVKERIARGHVEVSITFDRADGQALRMNSRLLEGYVAACDALREHFGALAPPDPVALLRVPGMVAGAESEMSPELAEQVGVALERLLSETLKELTRMRAAEGEALERDLRSRLDRLGALARNVADLAGRVPELYRRRLEHRLRELAGNDPSAPVLDPGRLAQEVVYLAARSDIAEELTRLESHLTQALVLLDEGPEVGKKLDFLLQEMNRESNTILSKTTDVPEAGPEISRQAIEMKTEIEKLREQAQNIE
jgi:uncharacterized protein (TIGR00255 family)